MEATGIPLIDVGPCLAGDGPGWDAAVAGVREAAETLGFFAIVGHGVDPRLIERMRAVSAAFFDLPPTRPGRTRSTGPLLGGLMYFPVRSEALGAAAGGKAPSDLKESLDFGPGFAGDDWPNEPEGMHAAWLDYYDAMGVLAAHLRRIFALATGVPADHFENSFVNHHSSLRVLNYPDQPESPPEGQLRAGVHTDYGLLTILHSDDAPGGLQVQVLDGGWVDASAVPGSFVVNIADAMMRWTNDRWRSTPHRVVNPPRSTTGSTRRQSIAYFHNPAKDAIIDCLSAFLADGESPRYDPITYGEYAELRFRMAHGAAGADTEPHDGPVGRSR